MFVNILETKFKFKPNFYNLYKIYEHLRQIQLMGLINMVPQQKIIEMMRLSLIVKHQ